MLEIISVKQKLLVIKIVSIEQNVQEKPQSDVC